jgi:hypothetical protein
MATTITTNRFTPNNFTLFNLKFVEYIVPFTTQDNVITIVDDFYGTLNKLTVKRSSVNDFVTVRFSVRLVDNDTPNLFGLINTSTNEQCVLYEINITNAVSTFGNDRVKWHKGDLRIVFSFVRYRGVGTFIQNALNEKEYKYVRMDVENMYVAKYDKKAELFKDQAQNHFDFKVVTGERTFKVHSFVLLKSPVLKQMLNCDSIEARNRTWTIGGIYKERAVYLFLEGLYTEEMDFSEKNVSTLCDLVRLCDMYDVKTRVGYKLPDIKDLVDLYSVWIFLDVEEQEWRNACFMFLHEDASAMDLSSGVPQKIADWIQGGENFNERLDSYTSFLSIGRSLLKE